MPTKKPNRPDPNEPAARRKQWLVPSEPSRPMGAGRAPTSLQKDLAGTLGTGKLDWIELLARQMPIDLRSNGGVGELLEYAGMRAEEAAHAWFQERRRLKFGPDGYGSALVLVRFVDRSLLNAMKRIGAVRKGAYPGTWILTRSWVSLGQECGLECAMAEAVREVLNANLGGRAVASVDSR